MPTPLRAIRIDDELWAAVQSKADDEEKTVSEVVRSMLTAWVTK